MVVATRDRAKSVSLMLESLFQVGALPTEIIVVDASSDPRAMHHVLSAWRNRVQNHCHVRWEEAHEAGAAVQRNQGVELSTQPMIWFVDDDVTFKSDCASRLLGALERDSHLGGVNAMIMNQSYSSPGVVSRAMLTFLHGRQEKTFAGKVIGPAINLLPEDSYTLPEVVPVEWLNTTCTMYRREALPSPPFSPFFTGYSFMEDVALSLQVGKNWKLANARTARIFHDSQTSDDKANAHLLSEMELTNRHYIMTEILGKRRWADYGRLALWEIFTVASAATSMSGRKKILPMISGKWSALRHLLQDRE